MSNTTNRHHHHPLQAALSSPTSRPQGFVPPARPFVLVPLYIYPAPGAWDPLFAAAEARPELDFWVVANPANGPGDGALPDANYVRELARLTALRNVKVVGYVHCSYGQRAAEDIVADVEAYGRWEGEMSVRGVEGETIIVDGIFIDEVPSSTEFVEYMAALASAIKTTLNRNILEPTGDSSKAAIIEGTASGEDEEARAAAATETAPAEAPAEAPAPAPAPIAATPAGKSLAADATTPPPTPPLRNTTTTTTTTASPPLPSTSSAVVIYNPGVVVDPIFYQAADYVVAFENAAAAWQLPAVRQGLARLPRALLPRSVVVAHSAAGGAVGVAQASRRAAEAGCVGQFVTGRAGYTEWCEDWMGFVGEMARRTLI